MPASLRAASNSATRRSNGSPSSQLVVTMRVGGIAAELEFGGRRRGIYQKAIWRYDGLGFHFRIHFWGLPGRLKTTPVMGWIFHHRFKEDGLYSLRKDSLALPTLNPRRG